MSKMQPTHIDSKPRNWRKNSSLKSMIIIAKECTCQGSIYFSAEVIINSEFIVTLRYQYGYSDSSIYQAAIDALYSLEMINFKNARWGEYEERKIRYHLINTPSTNKEVKRFGRGGI